MIAFSVKESWFSVMKGSTERVLTHPLTLQQTADSSSIAEGEVVFWRIDLKDQPFSFVEVVS
jgi:hypothetical protein